MLQLSSASNKRSYEAHLTSDDTEHLGNWEAAPAGTHHTPGKEHDLYDGRVKAAACGVGPRTAFTWQSQHGEFRQAVEDGRARSLLFWERRAISLANGEAGNAAIVALDLKNLSRAASGWHDAQRLEQSFWG